MNVTQLCSNMLRVYVFMQFRDNIYLYIYMCNFPVSFAFSTADLAENAQSYTEV